MDLARRIAARLLQGLTAIVLIAVVNFCLVHAGPGDPASVMAGEAGATDTQYVAQLRSQFELDRPLPVQLASYLSHLARLDLGYSYRQQQSVAHLIAERLPATLLLTGSAFVLSLGLGVTLGALASRHPGGWLDTLISAGATLCYATPLYWLALMAVLLFSVRLDWLPAFGYSSVGGIGGFGAEAGGDELHGLRAALDVAAHLVLPVGTLALFYMAIYVRMTRAAMLDVARLEFVRTARARGVRAARIWRAHVLRNALRPVVTLAGMQAGAQIGGAILTETVFAWPGIGRLMFDALMQRDYTVLLGCLLVTAALAVCMNLLTDCLMLLVDPRIAPA
ncbi:ABC transporter permease [Burkholderia oklahomensis]|uniref:Binding--dependent transport system inner membrane component family protein n=1 Tax=Burkholderia oklahomensis TaxID=342113 RepID=A0AAI8FNY3_9BURK|nr:ABC transporter permease [Burkholderia oklahomensis]AIO67579.1 binding--dependent transport system inner membrane component family protein [Burkholderia oklahomensis]AJX33449.1 binding--dependent transport system inner membrane component family protein [Burkholderia oklahomensis C6786]AOI42817.1 ABC transporter permease [Burkholderia oklahomensis EO147]AOI46306.1 ABC transporter permease [Burkholderia oklahomensis C6786]KUY53936.1 ABC transporter permease [Burkholderia oklahomensis C6786]